MADYEQDKARRANLTNMTLAVTEQSAPTPTQEENDKTKLGLMHPDEKARQAPLKCRPRRCRRLIWPRRSSTDLKPGMPLPPEEKPPPGSEPPPLGESRRAPERSVPRAPEPPSRALDGVADASGGCGEPHLPPAAKAVRGRSPCRWARAAFRQAGRRTGGRWATTHCATVAPPSSTPAALPIPRP